MVGIIAKKDNLWEKELITTKDTNITILARGRMREPVMLFILRHIKQFDVVMITTKKKFRGSMGLKIRLKSLRKELPSY